MRLIGSLTAQHPRRQSSVEASALSIGLALAVVLSWTTPVAADTPQEICDRLAGDPGVKLESIDVANAVPACAAAMAAGQTPRVEYEYGRALEKAGRRDEAKQMYQWAAEDNYAPAAAALARLSGAVPTASAAVASSSNAVPSDAEERTELAAQLDALGAITAGIAKSLPRDHDDPLAVLAKTGTDSTAILAWVRANTRAIPYAGMLRGSSGVLMDRAGNSLDRSLLLADLLSRAGHQVRLARTTLEPAVAAALAERFSTTIPAATRPAAPDRAAYLRVAGNDPRLDRAAITAAIDDSIAAEQQLNATVKSLYERVAPAVQQALGVDPERDQRLAANVATAFADHFWVQRRIATGWEDLDADADIVKAPVAAVTFGPSEVPDALKHKVTFKLLLETWSAGRLGETTLLERTWLPSELAQKTVTLTHALLPTAPIGQVVQQAEPQAAYTDDLSKAWVFEPILRVGSESITDKLYTVTGRVLPAGASSLVSLGVAGFANFAKVGAGVTAAFGDKPADDPSDESKSTVKVVAEWLEIDIAAPNRPLEQHRRAVFDLVGSAARASGVTNPPTIDARAKRQRAIALSGTVDAYVFGATPSTDWTQRVAAEGMGVALAQAADAMRTARGAEDVASRGSSVRLQLPLWGWATERASSGLLSQTVPVAANVALFWQSIALQPGESQTARVAFDIISNGAATDLSFDHRVAQGVLDTIVERAILGGTSPGGNAAALHALDIASGRDWVRLNAPPDVARLNISADAKARITAEIARGSIVIAPFSPVQSATEHSVAWWQVDPNTGATIGVGENGLGTAESEYALLIEKVEAQGWCMALMLGSVLAGHVNGKSMGLFMFCIAASSAVPFAPTVVAKGFGVLELVLRAFETWSAQGTGPPGPHGHH